MRETLLTSHPQSAFSVLFHVLLDKDSVFKCRKDSCVVHNRTTVAQRIHRVLRFSSFIVGRKRRNRRDDLNVVSRRHQSARESHNFCTKQPTKYSDSGSSLDCSHVLRSPTFQIGLIILGPHQSNSARERNDASATGDTKQVLASLYSSGRTRVFCGP